MRRGHYDTSTDIRLSTADIMLAKRLGLTLLGTLTFVGGTAALVQSASFGPTGIPRQLQPKYVPRLRQIEADRAEAMRIAADDQLRPVAHVETTRHDFGTLPPHATVDHTFTIENRGNAPLMINVQSTSCKCTAASTSDDRVEPGHTGTVTLKWNTGYRTDGYEQTAVIQTNDPARSRITLAVGGKVQADMVVPETASFGRADLTQPATASLMIHTQTFSDFEILDVQSDLPHFQWEVLPVDLSDARLVDLHPTAAWELQLTTIANVRGDFTGHATVTIDASGLDVPLTRRVDLRGKVRAPINFYSPDIHQSTGLDLGVMHNDRVHRRPVIARVRGGEGRSIEVLDVEPKSLVASLEPMPATRDGVRQYRLVIVSPEDADPVRFNLDSHTGFVSVGDPNDERFRNWLPISGAIVDLPSVGPNARH